MKKIVFVAAAMFLSFSLAFVGMSSISTPASSASPQIVSQSACESNKIVLTSSISLDSGLQAVTRKGCEATYYSDVAKCKRKKKPVDRAVCYAAAATRLANCYKKAKK